MRNVKTIKIDDVEITIKELRVRDIFNLFDIAEDLSLPGLKAHIEKILPAVTDIDTNVLLEMAPSEVEELWGAVKEVNDPFFCLVKKLGLMDVLNSLKNSLKTDFLNLFSESLTKATPTPGITDIQSSLKP